MTGVIEIKRGDDKTITINHGCGGGDCGGGSYSCVDDGSDGGDGGDGGNGGAEKGMKLLTTQVAAAVAAVAAVDGEDGVQWWRWGGRSMAESAAR